MIIVQLNGGLGNQMFQYSLGRVLSIKNNTQLKLDLRIFDNYTKGDTKRRHELDVFDIDAKKATKKETERFYKTSKIKLLTKRYLGINLDSYPPGYVREKSYDFQKSILDLRGDIYLDGYWQSEKYFKEYEDTIRRDFLFKSKPDGKNLVLFEKIEKTNSVSIHSRRQDYVKDKKTKAFHGVLGKDYYVEALNIIEKKIKKPTYFVFSDDIDWCKENLGFLNDVTFVTHNKGRKSYEDMRLMSNCKHNIIANSSFSWWGAWLNQNKNQINIAPKKWFTDSSLNSKDRYPESWITI